MEKETSNSLNSLPITLLTIAFVVLKLCNVIDWSWWWVLSPLWIGTLLVIVIHIAVFLYLRHKISKIPKNTPETVKPLDMDRLNEKLKGIQEEIDRRREARANP